MAWLLQMNHMRGRTEDMVYICYAETKEELVELLEKERVETYQTEGENLYSGLKTKWTKVFRKGGPLEWMNPPGENRQDNFIDIGTEEDWENRARLDYNNLLMSIPAIDQIPMHSLGPS